MTPPSPTPPSTASASLSPAASQAMLSISVRAQNVLGTLGYMPTVMLAALAERNWDTVSHHRRSVLKHHGLPGKRRAQKMLGANLRRQVQRRDNPQTIDDVRAEGFGVTLPGQHNQGKSGGWGDFLKNLEEGAEITASDWMAIPTTAKVAVFRKQLAAGKLRIVKRGILIREVGGKHARSEFMGVLRFGRSQPAMLGYYRQFDLVVQEEVKEYERDLDRVLTAAGRARLERTITTNRAARDAFRHAFQEFMRDNPGRAAEARKAANEAAKAVRQAAKARRT